MTDRIGEFLLRVGAMKPDQIEAVLQAQAAGDARRFGAIAVEKAESLDNGAILLDNPLVNGAVASSALWR